MAVLCTGGGRLLVLMVGDSKLLSHANITAMNDAGVGFLAPLATARIPAGLFAAINPAMTTAADYVAQRDMGNPAGQRCAYQVTEDVMHLAGPRKNDPVHHLRRILVHSSANQCAAGKARRSRLDKARTLPALPAPGITQTLPGSPRAGGDSERGSSRSAEGRYGGAAPDGINAMFCSALIRVLPGRRDQISAYRFQCRGQVRQMCKGRGPNNPGPATTVGSAISFSAQVSSMDRASVPDRGRSGWRCWLSIHGGRRLASAEY